MAPAAGDPAVPEVLLDPIELRATVARLGRELSERHDDGTVVVTVLKGGAIFAADLVRSCTFDAEIDFLAVSPYPSGGGRVRLVKDLEVDVQGRDVVLLDDVLDTGLSLNFLRQELLRRGPRSLSVCVLVDKTPRRLVPVEVDHVGVRADVDYVIGYGLDFAGRYRNLDLIAVADPHLLAEDPERYVDWAYTRRSP